MGTFFLLRLGGINTLDGLSMSNLISFTDGTKSRDRDSMIETWNATQDELGNIFICQNTTATAVLRNKIHELQDDVDETRRLASSIRKRKNHVEKS
jgi:hypothetical protein